MDWRFPEDVTGWLTPSEGAALAELARGKRVLEIGSYHGRSTICMAQVAEHVTVIDWGQGDDSAGREPSTLALLANLVHYGVRGRVYVHAASVAEAGALLPDAAYDLVFIDGAHDETSVRADLELARRVVKPGGVIAMHDSDHAPVQDAARAMLGWQLGLNGDTGGKSVDSLYHRPYRPEAPADPINRVVYVGLPRRPGEGGPEAEAPGHVSMVRPILSGHFRAGVVRTSLLNYTFNRLWVAALNLRGAGVTHFAMQHSDIRPAAGWADVLINELERTGADVVSAVVPIKDGRGVTSTGVRNARTGNNRRLTMRQVFDLPETFGLEDLGGTDVMPEGPPEANLLAINTGLWVCRVDVPWAEAFPGFRSCDAVRCRDGVFQACVVPEDWAFSEWLWRHDLRAVATRKVALVHIDDRGETFRNDHAWGTCLTDPGDNPKV